MDYKRDTAYISAAGLLCYETTDGRRESLVPQTTDSNYRAEAAAEARRRNLGKYDRQQFVLAAVEAFDQAVRG